MVQDNTVHLLRMALKAMNRFTSRYLPNANAAVVAATDEGISMSSNSSYGVVVACQSANEILIVVIICGWTGLNDRTIARLRELPDPQTRISGACNNQWFFGHHDWLSIHDFSGRSRFENDETSDCRGVALENVRALALLNVPHPH
jgi:hypothetical protein